MPTRKKINNKEYNKKLKKIGLLFQEKRLSVSKPKQSRESFIEERNDIVFNSDDASWISTRYLTNIENGNNLPSLEMLIKLSFALETNPVELFESIYNILYEKE